jgi:uncharacterized protein with HEPN domain
MKHPERIEDYLQHIAEAIARITGYVQGIDNAAALERDHKIGEAANRIHKEEPEFVAAHPSLPWHEMRGMRKRAVCVSQWVRFKTLVRGPEIKVRSVSKVGLRMLAK